MVYSRLNRTKLAADPLTYRYRYCERCAREWPANHSQCRTCTRWLGASPLERTEWQIAPCIHAAAAHPVAQYRHIAATALSLRIVAPTLRDAHLDWIAALLGDVTVEACEVERRGWLFWTAGGLRRSFVDGDDLRSRVERMLSKGSHEVPGTRVRWGLWTDDYILPCDEIGKPIVRATAAGSIFDLEPDGALLVSETVFRANRRWENFAGTPMRHLNGDTAYGYCPLGRKRPSALDHRATATQSPFVGREEELRRIEGRFVASDTGTRSEVLAILAPAGSGKTRLIEEWLRRHPDKGALAANFSLFGGDLPAFVSQLVELPEQLGDVARLVQLVRKRLEREDVRALVLDDLHWADQQAYEFLEALLADLASMRILVILSARPGARSRVASLVPHETVELPPLGTDLAEGLALRLSPSSSVAVAATRLANGNPLFVEQFCAWATESRDDGTERHPTTLVAVMDARIGLLDGAVKALRQAQVWTDGWKRQQTGDDAEALETKIGTWLDRLETGDYAAPSETLDLLVHLERINFDLFLVQTIAGRVRPRSNRLTESIERLLLGNAEIVLTEMTGRLGATGVEAANLFQTAERAARCAAESYDWAIAKRFYAIALEKAPPDRVWTIREQLDECMRRLDTNVAPAVQSEQSDIIEELERRPAVEPLRCPQVWLRLGKRLGCPRYYLRAEYAAEEINDRSVAATARHAWLRAVARPRNSDKCLADPCRIVL